MHGGEARNVVDGFFKGGNGFDGHAIGQKFSAKVFGECFFQVWVGGKGGATGFVRENFSTFLCEFFGEDGEVREAFFMNDKGVQGVANGDAAGFGVRYYCAGFLEIRVLVHVGVADSGAGFNYWYAGVFFHKID